ncbi:MAG: response regulator transcription factor [Campylobacterales bacterium]|nr:response regulator transcription factor [Campylobacterales bacterium]
MCDTLSDALSARGLSVAQAYNGAEAIEMIIEHPYEMLLLDINLPGKNGFEVLREAKRFYPSIAALFMTALDTSEHIEESFRSGGDDYIRKPFAMKELCFRIEAIYRRLYHLKSVDIAISSVHSYQTSTETLLENGTPLTLKPKLARLLYLLATHPTRMMTREMIEDRLWEGEDLPDAAILRIYIKELRAILGSDRITTIRGVGYRLETL